MTAPNPLDSRPSPQDALPNKQLGMVHWYQPGLLIRIGLRALVATVVGQIADNRELQAIDYRPQENLWDYSDRDELWFDFVADIGDGWEASYSVACAVARDELQIAGETLPRGELLFLGGDLVYPDPSHATYLTRALAPYQAASDLGNAFSADVFAVPGNHDWYDGLHAFEDIFCHDPAASPQWPFGYWSKRQTHSYFAQKLPHGWWLLAPDVQLNDSINPSQRDYFRRVATRLTADDRVIVIAPIPNWALVDPDTHNVAMSWISALCSPTGARIAAVLTGDLHHYSRYQSVQWDSATEPNAVTEAQSALQLITAGGGGAFLHPTHTLPDTVAMGTFSENQNATEFEQQKVWPASSKSRRMALGNLLFPVSNWQLSLFAGFVYTMLAWVLETRLLVGDATVSTLFHNMLENHAGVSGTLMRVVAMLPKSPEFALVLLLTALGLTAFNENCRTRDRILLGTLHTLLHFVGLIITYCVAVEMSGWLDAHFSTLSFSFFWFLLIMVGLGGGVGGMVIGLYLALSLNLFGANLTNAFSALRLSSHRNFLRLHIDSTGDLRVYALGIETPDGEQSIVRPIDSVVTIK